MSLLQLTAVVPPPSRGPMDSNGADGLATRRRPLIERSPVGRRQPVQRARAEKAHEKANPLADVAFTNLITRIPITRINVEGVNIERVNTERFNTERVQVEGIRT